MERLVGMVRIECVAGDITRQDDVDAVVNAANAQLRPGGGVAGAIHRAAGPQLYAACRPLAPLRAGEAVPTPGFRLPNRCVVHCLGPVYGVDEPSAAILAACYRNVLALDERHGVASLATPAVSTGVFGFPLRGAADVALRRVVQAAASLQRVRLVRFVLWGEEAAVAHEAALARWAGERT